MLDFTKFLPLTKVVHQDDGTVEVWGRAAVEEVDKARPPEIMDYVTSKPNFQKWSDSFQKATVGAGVEASLGNVRVMHNPMSAVGKLIHFEPQDADKAFYVGALVVDPVEVDKVKKGVYTGFSVGGRYAQRWYDNKYQATRYTASPVELSLVDAPCIPSATFSMVKSDGAEELMKFDPNVERTGNSVLLGSVDIMDNTPHFIHIDKVDTMSFNVPVDMMKAVPQLPVPTPMAIVGQPAQQNPPLAGINASLPSVVPIGAIQNQTPANTELLSAGRPEAVPEGEKIVKAHASATPIDDLAAPAMKPQPGPQQKVGNASPKQAVDLKAGEEEPPKEAEGEAPEKKDVEAAKVEFIKSFIKYGQDKVGIMWKGGTSACVSGAPPEPKKYGDPANFDWKCDTPDECKSAIANYNAGKGKDKYDPKEWNILGRRLARLIGENDKSEGEVKFDEKGETLIRENKGEKVMDKKMLELLKAVKGNLDAFKAELDKAKASGIEIDPSLLDQANAALGVKMEEAEAKAKADAGQVEPKGEKKTLAEPVAAKVSKAATTPPSADEEDMEEEDEEEPEEEEAAGAEEEMLASPGATVPTSTPATTATGPTTPSTKSLAKRDGPLATNPPQAPNLILTGGVDDKLPEFMNAMEGGDLRLAKQLAGFRYDEFMNKAQRALLTEGGWKYENIHNFSRLPILTGRTADPGLLQKSIDLADLPGVYLMRLARLMLPMYAGLRRRMPSSTPPVGSNYAQWRAQLGMANFDYAAAMSVAEKSIGQEIDEDFLLFAAPFMRTSLYDKVSLEAIYGANGYDDPLQVAVIRALTTLLVTEEKKLYGDNSAVIGPPASVTAVGAGTGSMGNADDTIKVSALCYRGYLATRRGKATVGATDVDGETGATASAAVDLSTSETVTVTFPAVRGAVAYNIYWAPHGSNPVWVAYTTKTSVSIDFSGATAYVPNAADATANTKGYEGLLSWAERSTVYTKTIPTKTFTDMIGEPLTNYAGGIEEFDTLLSALWTNWQVAPSLIVASPQGVQHLTKQLLATANPGLYRFEVSQERGTLSGGVFVSGYVNKFATWADGAPRIIDVIAHPYAPNGTFLFLTETIPYPMAREARGFSVDVLIPYTYFPLAQTEIAYPFSMLVSETVECFHPSAQSAIVGCSDES